MTGAWRIAARNLGRNRRRNLATLLAVALGFAGLALLGGYVTRVEAFLRTNAVYLQHGGHVAVYGRGGLDRAVARPSRHSLSAGDQAAIASAAAADARVAFVAPYLRGMGLAGNGCRSLPFSALGIDPSLEARVLAHPDVVRYSPDLARPLRGRHLFETESVGDRVGLAAGLAALLGKTRVLDDFAGDVPLVRMPVCEGPERAASLAADANLQLAGLTFDGSMAALDAEVVTLFHTPSTDTEDQALHVPLGTLRRLYDTDAATYVALFLHDWRDTPHVAADLRARLARAGVAAEVHEYSDDRVNPYYTGTMAFLGSMAGFIVLVVSAVVVLGVMNATTLTVYERSRELGTLRAVGFTRRQAAGLVVREVALVALVGIAAGFVLAHAVAAAVVQAGVRVSPPGVPGTLQVVVTPPATVALGLAATLVPLALVVAWAVARRRLAERTADLLIAVNA